MALVKVFGGSAPRVDPDAAFLAENAALIGDVAIGPGVSVWYGAVLRADTGSITVGANTNIQDCAVVHTGTGFPVRIGSNVTVGHCALVHGCTVGDGALIGMHATVLNGAVIGAGSVVAAGALVTEGAVIPPGSLVMGVPGKVRGPVGDALADATARNTAGYVALGREHQAKN